MGVKLVHNYMKIILFLLFCIFQLTSGFIRVKPKVDMTAINDLRHTIVDLVPEVLQQFDKSVIKFTASIDNFGFTTQQEIDKLRSDLKQFVRDYRQDVLYIIDHSIDKATITTGVLFDRYLIPITNQFF